jgi:hypothetical protein
MVINNTHYKGIHLQTLVLPTTNQDLAKSNDSACIQGVPGINISQDMAYFFGFPCKQILEEYLLGLYFFLSHPFQFIIH